MTLFYIIYKPAPNPLPFLLFAFSFNFCNPSEKYMKIYNYNSHGIIQNSEKVSSYSPHHELLIFLCKQVKNENHDKIFLINSDSCEILGVQNKVWICHTLSELVCIYYTHDLLRHPLQTHRRLLVNLIRPPFFQHVRICGTRKTDKLL